MSSADSSHCIWPLTNSVYAHIRMCTGLCSTLPACWGFIDRFYYSYRGLSVWHQQRTTEISSQSKYNCLFVSRLCSKTSSNENMHFEMLRMSFNENSRARHIAITCQCVGEKSSICCVCLQILRDMNTWWKWSHWSDLTDAERRGEREDWRKQTWGEARSVFMWQTASLSFLHIRTQHNAELSFFM